MLTGRPEEEMPASAGDLLQDLSQLHERAQQVMQGIAQALWPSSFLPKGRGMRESWIRGYPDSRTVYNIRTIEV